MIIKEIKYFPFSLKLNTPFQNSNFTITEKKGFLLELKDELGNTSYGECSPLAGFSKESIEDCEIELATLVNALPSIRFDNLSSFSCKNSAVQFAVDQCFLNLFLSRNKNLLNHFNFQNTIINVNAVIGLVTIKEAIESITEKISLGYSTFKLKVGRDNPYDDFGLIERIREEFGTDITLRLDANRKWSADEAIEYLGYLHNFNLEFVEEPCDSICSNLRTMEEVPVEIAIDESIESFENAMKVIKECKVNYLILKPMINGGIFSSIELIKAAEEVSKKVIISSSFESSIGKSALVFLSALTNHNLAHGLDTLSFFENDVFSDPYKPEKGKIFFRPEELPLNFTSITK